MDLEKGFCVGDRQFAWGTALSQAADALLVPPDASRGSRLRSIEVACGASYGIETISAELTAPRDGRPITALKYELASIVEGIQPELTRWFQRLTSTFGLPTRSEHHRPASGGIHPGSVRFYANWCSGDHSLGLSLYGGPREVSHGLAGGCLWVTWATEAAARPFVDDWLKRSEGLVAEAETHSGIVSYTLAIAGHPTLGITRDSSVSARASIYSLQAPQLLLTPQTIARQLGRHGFAFWRSGDYKRWYASTRWETVEFGLGQPVEIDFYDIKPAKGGGFSGITVDDWRVRDLHGSRAINEAIEALQTIPGVTIRRVDGYDC